MGAFFDLCDGDSLPLTARDLDASFTDDCLVAVSQFADEVASYRRAGCPWGQKTRPRSE